MRGLWDFSRNNISFIFSENMASSTVPFWVSSYFLYACLLVLSFSGVQWNLNWGIYSGGGLGDDTWPAMRLFWLGRSDLYCTGSWSGLHFVIPVLEKWLATCKTVCVMMSESEHAVWEWSQHGMCCGKSERTKKFTHCRFLLIQTFWRFIRVLYSNIIWIIKICQLVQIFNEWVKE
jgi:hypothetical protein